MPDVATGASCALRTTTVELRLAPDARKMRGEAALGRRWRLRFLDSAYEHRRSEIQIGDAAPQVRRAGEAEHFRRSGFSAVWAPFGRRTSASGQIRGSGRSLRTYEASRREGSRGDAIGFWWRGLPSVQVTGWLAAARDPSDVLIDVTEGFARRRIEASTTFLGAVGCRGSGSPHRRGVLIAEGLFLFFKNGPSRSGNHAV